MKKSNLKYFIKRFLVSFLSIIFMLGQFQFSVLATPQQNGNTNITMEVLENDQTKATFVNQSSAEPVEVNGEGKVKISISGNQIQGAQYRILDQNGNTDGWQDIGTTSGNSDVDLDNDGKLNWESYDTSNIGNGAWKNKNRLYKYKLDSGIRSADLNNGTIFHGWTWNLGSAAYKYWGYFTPPQTGDYYFGIYSDNGSYGYIIDGDSAKQEIVGDDAFSNHSSDFYTKNHSIHLESGKYYPIYLEYYNSDEGGQFQLFYKKNFPFNFGLLEWVFSIGRVEGNWFYPSNTSSSEEFESHVSQQNGNTNNQVNDTIVNILNEPGIYTIETKVQDNKGVTTQSVQVLKKGYFTLRREIANDSSQGNGSGNEGESIPTFYKGDEFSINYKIQPLDIPADEFQPGDTKGKKIVLVMDNSWSMRMRTGKWGWYGPRRISLARDAAMEFVDKFQQMSNVEIGFVTYADEAEVKSELTSNLNALKSSINNSLQENNCGWGTNTGDGLRKAYYMLQEYSDTDYDKYIVLLTDGDEDEYSYYVGTNGEYKVPFNKHFDEYRDNPRWHSSEIRFYAVDNNVPNEEIGGLFRFEPGDKLYRSEMYTKSMIDKMVKTDSNIQISAIAFNNGRGKKIEKELEQIGAKSYLLRDDNTLDEIYDSIAEEIGYQVSAKDFVRSIDFNETLPEGIHFVDENLDPQQSISIPFNNIAYQLQDIVDEETGDVTSVYRAEPIEFTMNLKIDDQYNFNNESTVDVNLNNSRIQYKNPFASNEPLKQSFPDLQVRLNNNIGASFKELTVEPLNGQNQVYEDRDFDLLFTLTPEDIDKNFGTNDVSIKNIDYYFQLPEEFQYISAQNFITGEGMENVQYDEETGLLKITLPNISYEKESDNLYKADSLKFVVKVKASESRDTEYEINNCKIQYAPYVYISNNGNNQGDDSTGVEKKEQQFNDISMNVLKEKTVLNLSRDIERDNDSNSNFFATGEEFTINYVIQPEDVDLRWYFDSNQLSNITAEEIQDAINNLSANNLIFSEKVPEGIEITETDNLNNVNLSNLGDKANAITATPDSINYIYDSASKTLKADPVEFSITFKSYKQGTYNMKGNDEEGLTYSKVSYDDKNQSIYNEYFNSIIIESSLEAIGVNASLATEDYTVGNYELVIGVNEVYDLNNHVNKPITALYVDGINLIPSDHNDVNITEVSSGNEQIKKYIVSEVPGISGYEVQDVDGMQVYTISVNKELFTENKVTIKAEDGIDVHSVETTVPVINLDSINEEELETKNNTISLSTEIGSIVANLDVNSHKYIENYESVNAQGNYTNSNVDFNEGDNHLYVKVINEDGNTCEVTLQLHVDIVESTIVRQGSYLRNNRINDYTQITNSYLETDGTKVSVVNAIKGFKNDFALLVQINTNHSSYINMNFSDNYKYKQIQFYKYEIVDGKIVNSTLQSKVVSTSTGGFTFANNTSSSDFDPNFTFENGKEYILVYSIIPDGDEGDQIINDITVDSSSREKLLIDIVGLPDLE